MLLANSAVPRLSRRPHALRRSPALLLLLLCCASVTSHSTGVGHVRHAAGGGVPDGAAAAHSTGHSQNEPQDRRHLQNCNGCADPPTCYGVGRFDGYGTYDVGKYHALSNCRCAAGVSHAEYGGSSDCASLWNSKRFCYVVDSMECTDQAPGALSGYGYSHVACENCKSCPSGKYSDSSGATSCKTGCPPGTYLIGGVVGGLGCRNCPSGKFKTSWGKTCADCPAGQYVEHADTFHWLSKCKACPAAKYTESSGSSSCKTGCLPGEYVNPGSSFCVPCQPGQHKSAGGAGFCTGTVCEAGTIGVLRARSPAEAQCTACPSGKYSGATGAESCSNCAAGRFNSQAGASDCKLCAAGRYGDQTGRTSATSCAACPSGRWTAPGVGTICKVELSDADLGVGNWSLSSAAVAYISFAPALSVQLEHDGSPLLGCDGVTVEVRASGGPGRLCNRTADVSCAPLPGGSANATLAASGTASFPGLALTTHGMHNISARAIFTPASLCKSEGADHFSVVATIDVSCSFCTPGYACPSTTQQIACIKGHACSEGVQRSCTAGRYQPAAKQAACLDCPPGRHSTGSAATACLACPAGRFSEGGASRCTSCAAGRFGDSESRLSADCSGPCPASKFAAAPGSSNCSACMAGTHQPDPERTFCEPCPAGKFSSAAASACDSCPQGQWSTLASSTCTVCERGRFRNARMLGGCVKCAAGEKPLPNRTACAPFCDIGHFCQAGLELNCSLGFYQDDRGQPTCKTCPDGKYQDEQAAASCKACADATCASGAKRKSCSGASKGYCGTCNPGTFVDAGLCRPCAAGSFTDSESAATCTACLIGQYQPYVGKSFCVAHTTCPQGKYVRETPTALADRVCEDCAAGKFGNATNAASCTDCPAKTFQLHGGQPFCERTTPCVPGHYVRNSSDPKPSRCAACDAGQISNKPDAPSCLPCAAGAFQPKVGQAFCTQHTICAKGERALIDPTTTTDRNCEACAAGQFGTALNAANCTECPLGKHQSLTGQVGCDSCIVGKAGKGTAPRTSATTHCEACSGGTYSTSAGASICSTCASCTFAGATRNGCGGASEGVCLPCSVGKFKSGAGSCESCAVGSYQDQAGQTDCISCVSKECPGGTRQSCGESFEGFCAACPAGTRYDNASSSCHDCSPGRWCVLGKEQRCGGANLYCPASSSTPRTVAVGHYSVPLDVPEDERHGQKPCEEGFDCNRGVRQACPRGRVCLLRSTANIFDAAGNRSTVQVTSQERCPDNFFVFNGNCTPCPGIGAQCLDGQIRLMDDHWFDAQHGPLLEFWGMRENGTLPAATNIYRCVKGACEANTTAGKPVCTEGRTGRLCAVCDSGFYSTNSLECKKCPVTDTSAMVQYIIGVLILLGAGLGAHQVKKRIERRHPQLAAAIRSKLPEVLKLLTGLFQILGAFATVLYRVPWPGAFTAVTSFLGVMSLDIFALPTLRCSHFGKSYYTRFSLHLTTMLVVTALFVALLLFSYSKFNASRAKPIRRTLVWNLMLPFLFLIYPSISRTVILMLRCRMVDGHSYLLSDIALSCETAEYAGYKSYAIFGVLVFPVGIIVFFTVLVGRQRHKLPPDWYPALEPQKAKEAFQEYRKAAGRTMAKPFAAWKAAVWDKEMATHAKVYQRFGFLFAAYTKRLWWSESLITLYKLCMTVLILFVSDSDELKILFGMLGATIMMAVFSFFQPFKHPDILSINTVGQLIILMVLFAAQFLLVSGGGVVIAVCLVALTLAPLVAGVVLTLRLPDEAIVSSADDLLVDSVLSGVTLSAAQLSGVPLSGAKCDSGAVSDAEFLLSNPMHAHKPAKKAKKKKTPLPTKLSSKELSARVLVDCRGSNL